MKRGKEAGCSLIKQKIHSAVSNKDRVRYPIKQGAISNKDKVQHPIKTKCCI